MLQRFVRGGRIVDQIEIYGLFSRVNEFESGFSESFSFRADPWNPWLIGFLPGGFWIRAV
jgi:hypothetical protein